MSTIIGAAATKGLAQTLTAPDGCDRVVAYHSSAFRRRGLPSVAGLLPWANANEQTLSFLAEVVEGAGDTPTLATICANDGVLPRGEAMARAADLGARGVLNAPTVGLLEGAVRDVVEAEGLGRCSEMALIEDAVAADLEAWAYVFDAGWTSDALTRGVTGMIIHLGITGYTDLATELARATDCLEVASARPDVPVLLHGGSLTHPARLAAVVGGLPARLRGHIDGFMGASVFELVDDPVQAVVQWRSALDLPLTEGNHDHPQPG